MFQIIQFIQYRESLSLRFSSNSEAFASELGTPNQLFSLQQLVDDCLYIVITIARLHSIVKSLYLLRVVSTSALLHCLCRVVFLSEASLKELNMTTCKVVISHNLFLSSAVLGRKHVETTARQKNGGEYNIQVGLGRILSTFHLICVFSLANCSFHLHTFQSNIPHSPFVRGVI